MDDLLDTNHQFVSKRGIFGMAYALLNYVIALE